MARSARRHRHSQRRLPLPNPRRSGPVAMENDHPPSVKSDESRPPTLEDLVKLCRALNEAGARYLVIGGFAIRAAGFSRNTMDVDLLIDTGTENERQVFAAMMNSSRKRHSGPAVSA